MTETEIAKEIVHKMIDNTELAEDAYPNLRKRLHDAVDEYEPNCSEKPNNCKDEQTDWKDQMWKEACREEADRLLETQMEDEPQTKYKVTIPYGDDVPLKKIIELELKDEPQTDCAWK